MLTPGTRLRRYEVRAPLGAGGMGEVYLGHDTELDRTVAIKVLSDGEDQHDDRIRRFLQEARAAIALNHPNVAHIYDVGEEHGVRFMAMEYVEGETLRALLEHGRLSLDTALEIASQTAAALGSAHALGIVHRDIKPENVMLRPDGYVKVLDFGLAKLTMRPTSDAVTQVAQTTPGLVMGTMHYMSPEQLRGEDVDPRADVFSLGVMLYELVSGHRPFEASSASGIIAAILTEAPPPLDDDVPIEVRQIVEKALAKHRNDRYADARELAYALKLARGTQRIRSGDVPTQVLRAVPRRMPVAKLAIAALIVVAIAIGAWLANRARLVRDARAQLPKIEQLAEQRRFFEAYDLATEAQKHLHGDERLSRAIASVTAPIFVTSEPKGASVFVERVLPNGQTGPRVDIGTTPLDKFPIAIGDYVVTVERSGFAPFTATISLTPIRASEMFVAPPPPKLAPKLQPRASVPEEMAWVPGGEYELVSWAKPAEATATLAPFLIDRFEVSNADFAEFVNAGGYRRRELWKHPFVKGSKTLTFDEAMRELVDATGLPGPRNWSQQKYPQGRGRYPVTDVTWYEAAAYAEFRGKSLPTYYQWEKAARNGRVTPFGSTFPWGVLEFGRDVQQRANFNGAGPLPVDSMRGGLSPFGVYHMAGNVNEWCLNARDDGRVASGGGFDSVQYVFGNIGGFPAFFASPDLGFRCAKTIGGGESGTMPIDSTGEVLKPKPVGDAEFRTFLRYYDYPATPLGARVVERIDAEAWTVERIVFSSNGENVEAYLLLPKNFRPPYQVVHFVPAADVASGFRPLLASIESTLLPVVRSGRAIFAVTLPGYIGREGMSSNRISKSNPAFAEAVAKNVIDLRRGLDYLASRPDIDRERIGFFGPSAGSTIGVILAGVEHRYRSIMFGGIGISQRDLLAVPRASRVNFAPRIRAPILVLNGRWDENHPLRTEAQPLVDLFPEPKRLVIFDGGHIPPLELMVRTLNSWFDETLGSVR